jgi:transposase
LAFPLPERPGQQRNRLERLVSQRTGIINQIRAFMLERGIAARQGQRFLRAELPRILATPSDVLSPRMVRAIEDLATRNR